MWFGGGVFPAGAVWLYAGGAMKLVATVKADSFAVAGGCIPL